MGVPSSPSDPAPPGRCAAPEGGPPTTRIYRGAGPTAREPHLSIAADASTLSCEGRPPARCPNVGPDRGRLKSFGPTSWLRHASVASVLLFVPVTHNAGECAEVEGLTAADREVLLGYARDTWKSMAAMAEGLELPADGLRRLPNGRWSASPQTTPTDIGAYLWSTLAARSAGDHHRGRGDPPHGPHPGRPRTGGSRPRLLSTTRSIRKPAAS